MSERRKPVWPWIVGAAGVCLAALLIGATCFFAVLWIGNANFRQYISDRSQKAESRE